MTQEPQRKKHLWWDACGLRLAVIGLVVSLSIYYWLA